MAFLLIGRRRSFNFHVCHGPRSSATRNHDLRQVCDLHSNSQTHYDVLGVGRNASKADIRAAFVKLSKKHHPDISKASNANKHFININEAYSVLISPSKRYQYDMQLHTTDLSVHGHRQHAATTDRPFGGYYPGASMYEYSRNYEYHTLSEEEWTRLYNQSVQRPSHSRIITWLLVMMVLATTVHSLRIGYAHKKFQEMNDRETQRNFAIYNSIRERAKSSTLEEQLQRTLGKRT